MKCSTIKVFVTDDHPIVLSGIKESLAEVKHIQVVGEAHNGREMLNKLQMQAVDVVLLDIQMPEMDGMETIRRLKKLAPAVKIMVFTMHDDAEYVVAMLSLGAKGYVLKSTSPCELIRAIESVHAGNVFLSPQVSNVLVDCIVEAKHSPPGQESRRFTGREIELLDLMAEGKTTNEIAEALAISPRTVEAHRSRMIKKLGVRHQNQLMKYAVERLHSRSE